MFPFLVVVFATIVVKIHAESKMLVARSGGISSKPSPQTVGHLLTHYDFKYVHAFQACQANLAVNLPVVCGPLPKEVYSCLGAPKVVKLEVARQCEKDLSECERMTCLFNKSGWMKDDKIDKEKLSAHFDQLAKDYPEWEPAVQSAKAMCLTDDLPAQGIHLNCPAYDAMTCSFASFIRNAQPSQWSLSPECSSSRRFAAACPVCPADCFAAVIPNGSCNACQGLQRSP